MKQMQRDPLASSKARKAERKADEKSGLITIKPLKLDGSSSATTNGKAGAGATGTGGGFKKSGFKSAFGGVATESSGDGSNNAAESQGAKPVVAGFKKVGAGGGEEKPQQEKATAAIERQRTGAEADEESDTEDEGYEMYDPRHPTDRERNDKHGPETDMAGREVSLI